MSENTKLTDEQVETVEEFLEENKSEEVKKMEEAIKDVKVDPNAPLEEEDANITVNELGKPVQVAAENEDDPSIYADLFEDGKIPEVDLVAEELADDTIITVAKEMLHCSDNEAKELLEVIKEYKKLSPELRANYPAYMKLPNSMKAQINRINGNTKTYRNDIARSFIEGIIKEAALDKEVNNVKDLMGSIAKELDMSNTIEMYTKYQKGLMEDNLRAHADKLREEGDNEKADKLNLISDAYHESYTLEALRKDINENPGKYKIKPIEIEKIETRVFDEFNRKYIDSEFNIPDIKEAMMIATSKLIQYEVKDIMKFFIIFCKYCRGFVPENIEQHTFMYYTLMNIITLNFEDVDEDNTFAKDIRKVLSETIDLIKEKFN